ncbi:MAG: ABC transporter permease [Balneola sp.]
MLKNYLKIALRNLSKQKGYTFINTAGLAIGMGICLFLVLLTQYAVNMDKHHENSDRIYLLADAITQQNGNVLDVGISPSPWGNQLKQEYPEIEESVRLLDNSGNVRYGEKILRQGITYVDEGIFNVFTYSFKYGSSEGALSRPNTIVLTEDMSIRYFANENPVGKTLLVNDEAFEVTGVLAKKHPQSSFYYNALASFKSLDENDYPAMNDWRSHNLYTYLLLQEGANIENLQVSFSDFIAKNVGEEYVDRYRPFLANFEDLYLYSNLYGERWDSLDVSYLYIFSAIGLLILFIACINFINLATAQGMKRAREIGVRKVLGAYKKQLVFQFIAEALILSVLAVIIGVVFVELALPWFNDIAEWSVTTNYLSNPFYLFSIAAIVLLVGTLAGAYPAFFMSAFRPVKVLKGDQASESGKSWLKTTLVVTQFSVAIFLIISSASVENQLSFIKDKDLGFEQSDMYISSIPGISTKQSMETLRGVLFKIPGVSEVSFSSNIPGEESGSRTQLYPEGDLQEGGVLINNYSVDPYFLTQFEIDLVQGRDFSIDLASDSISSIIINEAAVRKFGWEEPIGRTINQRFEGKDPKDYVVVGVVKDFHFETLHTSIQPLILFSDPSRYFDLSIKLRNADLEPLTAQIGEVLKTFNNGIPTWHYFLEDDLADEYTTENVIAEMLRYFTFLTLFIACLGLLGLVSFTVINRKKEIGIRKVLGASIIGLVQALSFNFIKLVFIGFLIGAPLAYFLISEWLKSFAYSVAPGIPIFVGAAIITMLIAFLTIGYQTVKAALANPIESLKNE